MVYRTIQRGKRDYMDKARHFKTFPQATYQKPTSH